MTIFYVDNHLLVGLVNFAINNLLNHFRTRHAQLKAFATHIFNQYRQVQFTTTGNDKFVGRITLLYTQCNVSDQFLIETIFDVTAGDVLAFFTGKWRIVDLEGHAYGRLVDRQRRQSFNTLRTTQGVGNAKLVHTSNTNNVTGVSNVCLNALQAVITHNLQHLGFTLVAFMVNHNNLLVWRQAAARDAANADYTHIAAVIQGRNLHLERRVCI